ncbi:MAG: LCP family protein [Rubrobacteraceae bacterium]
MSGDKDFASKAGGGAAGVFEMLASVSDDPQNILLVGVDERPEVEGSRTDTMMLVRVYPKTGDMKIVSIPRDFLVEVEPGVETRINAAYSYDGISGTIGAVENFSNVYIDHYAVVDLEGFEAMVDAVGGVKVDVEEGLVPDNWKVKDGPQQLNGRRALLYARYRNTEGGDLDRIKRQQEVLAALRSKALRWRSAERFPQITRAVVDNVDTDLNIAEVTSLGRAMSKRARNGLMTSTQLEGRPETLEDGSKVLVPDDAANEYILQEFRN